MVAATTMSGQPFPVPNTPSAASSTARLPSTSLRVQIHAERMFESPSRNAHSSANETALARSAAVPTAPMVNACGTVPCQACQAVTPMTQSPKRPMVAPFAKAAMARKRSAMPTTSRLMT